MKTVASLIVILAAATGPSAFAADRLTDRDLKGLVDRIDQGRDRFEDALDSQLKRSVLRGPSGEVDVDKFLDDFEKSVDTLGDRLKPEYSASLEAAAVLKQGSTIDGYLRRQAGGTKGDSEWGRLATDLTALAGAYGAAFPLAEGVTVRRLTDREVAAALEAVEVGARAMKKPLDSDLKKDAGLDKAARQAIVAETDLFAQEAKALRGRVEDAQPSSAEAGRLLARATKFKASLDSHPSPTSAKAWAQVTQGLQSVAGAYGRSWPDPK